VVFWAVVVGVEVEVEEVIGAAGGLVLSVGVENV